ncbi:hypothetical protein KHA80_14520 [Anaerobacillus sp. HL2]|nr:hypothetical protein KHA80_14520 [Anaerobacillus sp. HL2]
MAVCPIHPAASQGINRAGVTIRYSLFLPSVLIFRLRRLAVDFRRRT